MLSCGNYVKLFSGLARCLQPAGFKPQVQKRRSECATIPAAIAGDWEDAMKTHCTLALVMLAGIGVGAVGVLGLAPEQCVVFVSRPVEANFR